MNLTLPSSVAPVFDLKTAVFTPSWYLFLSKLINTLSNPYAYFTPLTGTTVLMVKPIAVLNPAGTLANRSVTLPAKPANGQIAGVATTQAVTALTVTSDQTVTGAPSSLTAGQTFRMISHQGSWYPSP